MGHIIFHIEAFDRIIYVFECFMYIKVFGNIFVLFDMDP